MIDYDSTKIDHRCIEIALDVSQAGAAPHHLAVGVYSTETGRLPAVDRDGVRLPDDQAELGIGELGIGELGN